MTTKRFRLDMVTYYLGEGEKGRHHTPDDGQSPMDRYRTTGTLTDMTGAVKPMQLSSTYGWDEQDAIVATKNKALQKVTHILRSEKPPTYTTEYL